MKISILYFDGCPNHPPVVEMARRLVAEHSLNADIEEVEVAPDDVVRLRFLGSPTVQVDGNDIDPVARERTDYAMSCRVYDTPDGLPSEATFLAALGISTPTTVKTSGDRAGFIATGGSVVTAILSSACCWLPLLLLSFGASAAGASAFFERWRPVFIVVATASLAIGFYFAYFRKTACAEGCCAGQPRRGRRPRTLQRAMLWCSAVIVAAFIFFPSYIGLLLDGSNSATAANVDGLTDTETREYVFDVSGMHCEGCAALLRNDLAKIDGVAEVDVDYDGGMARLRSTRDGIEARVVEAASRLGYTASRHAESQEGNTP